MHIKITSTRLFSAQKCETLHYMDDLPGVDHSPYRECPVIAGDIFVSY